ncbi:MAG: hypothetical protein M3220_21390 [Chloroflexota bacterium]|nr:hypothetical protein [Chloroflexota bacterium]
MAIFELYTLVLIIWFIGFAVTLWWLRFSIRESKYWSVIFAIFWLPFLAAVFIMWLWDRWRWRSYP